MRWTDQRFQHGDQPGEPLQRLFKVAGVSIPKGPLHQTVRRLQCGIPIRRVLLGELHAQSQPLVEGAIGFLRLARAGRVLGQG